MEKLEGLVKKANLDYRIKKVAIVQKIETPIVMTSEGLVMKPSTVDFFGCVGGRAIAFDAKETKNKTSFPLSNIHQHQLDFLDYWSECGGIAFFLIHFTSLYKDKAFITPLSKIHQYWDNPKGRKSIPIKDFNSDWLVEINNYLNQYI